MAKDAFPVTPAIRALRAASVAYTPHLYDYVEKGGTGRASAELGVDEHAVIKTLVFEDERGRPLLALMHGDRSVGPGLLAKAIGAKRVAPCDPSVAQKHTGYLVGGTSALGTKTALPVYVQTSIFSLTRLLMNGGKRGFLVEIEPSALRVLLPELVEVEIAAPVEP